MFERTGHGTDDTVFYHIIVEKGEMLKLKYFNSLLENRQGVFRGPLYHDLGLSQSLRFFPFSRI